MARWKARIRKFSGSRDNPPSYDSVIQDQRGHAEGLRMEKRRFKIEIERALEYQMKYTKVPMERIIEFEKRYREFCEDRPLFLNKRIKAMEKYNEGLKEIHAEVFAELSPEQQKHIRKIADNEIISEQRKDNFMKFIDNIKKIASLAEADRYSPAWFHLSSRFEQKPILKGLRDLKTDQFEDVDKEEMVKSIKDLQRKIQIKATTAFLWRLPSIDAKAVNRLKTAERYHKLIMAVGERIGINQNSEPMPKESEIMQGWIYAVSKAVGQYYSQKSDNYDKIDIDSQNDNNGFLTEMKKGIKEISNVSFERTRLIALKRLTKRYIEQGLEHQIEQGPLSESFDRTVRYRDYCRRQEYEPFLNRSERLPQYVEGLRPFLKPRPSSDGPMGGEEKEYTFREAVTRDFLSVVNNVVSGGVPLSWGRGYVRQLGYQGVSRKLKQLQQEGIGIEGEDINGIKSMFDYARRTAFHEVNSAMYWNTGMQKDLMQNRFETEYFMHKWIKEV